NPLLPLLTLAPLLPLCSVLLCGSGKLLCLCFMRESLLRQRDELLHDGAQFLRLLGRGHNATLNLGSADGILIRTHCLDQAGCHITKHGLPVTGITPQNTASSAMSHGSSSNFI